MSEQLRCVHSRLDRIVSPPADSSTNNKLGQDAKQRLRIGRPRPSVFPLRYPLACPARGCATAVHGQRTWVAIKCQRGEQSLVQRMVQSMKHPTHYASHMLRCLRCLERMYRTQHGVLMCASMHMRPMQHVRQGPPLRFPIRIAGEILHAHALLNIDAASRLRDFIAMHA